MSLSCARSSAGTGSSGRLLAVDRGDVARGSTLVATALATYRELGMQRDKVSEKLFEAYP
jgi:hypothetical protein